MRGWETRRPWFRNAAGSNGKAHRGPPLDLDKLINKSANPAPANAGEATKAVCQVWPVWHRHRLESHGSAHQLSYLETKLVFWAISQWAGDAGICQAELGVLEPLSIAASCIPWLAWELQMCPGWIMEGDRVLPNEGRSGTQCRVEVMASAITPFSAKERPAISSKIGNLGTSFLNLKPSVDLRGASCEKPSPWVEMVTGELPVWRRAPVLVAVA